jgi:hypothetical protein
MTLQIIFRPLFLFMFLGYCFDTISDGPGKQSMAKDEIRSVVLNLRMRPSLKAALEKLAERDQRTLSNWIELVLERAVKDAESKRR